MPSGLGQDRKHLTKYRHSAVDVVLGRPVPTGIAWHQGVDGSSSASIVHVHQRGATCGISNVLVALQRLSSCVLRTQLVEQALQSLAPRAAEVGGPMDDSFCTAYCENMSHGMMAGILKVRLGVGIARMMHTKCHALKGRFHSTWHDSSKQEDGGRGTLAIG
jgi:hypothetical protein